ncbi:hypothetical protein TNCV_3545901 [Trichonephila clavipes]|nr:hypothetical protein TNCV_3545901 [Trichonephila clavipes]
MEKRSKTSRDANGVWHGSDHAQERAEYLKRVPPNCRGSMSERVQLTEEDVRLKCHTRKTGHIQVGAFSPSALQPRHVTLQFSCVWYVEKTSEKEAIQLE